ncbi:ATP-binding protein [Mycolicibacterium vanbaalenii]|uniref:ATP-binding protein n=1 Tax=Mycolicibacterium vanbaalenii TaxID=110539 RepID=UPI0023BA80E8|nr:LuxR family transcriptional regulator [Mycolicibacterium vanbaalenii]
MRCPRYYSFVVFAEREQELGVLAARSADARAGRGGMVIVSGESGVGKTSFVETFLECRADGSRVLWGMCDPLSTPRPLGPIHDLAGHFGETTQRSLLGSDHPHETFAAVFEELRKVPSVLVIDDLHWADQAVVDLLRFVLRRIRHTHSLVIGTVRDDDIGISHPMRALLGDVARSTSATSLELPPLSLGAVTKLVGARPIDPVGLHRITGGNAFFVVEMLDHAGSDLPTTVRDAILSRTVDLGVDEWDVLYLLACAPGSIPDYLLADLGVSVSALRTLADAKLIRQTGRGVTFRHDLCRLAVASVIPPGAEVAVHRRMIAAYDQAPQQDPSVITHHALGAGDRARIVRAASEAGPAAARAGAHIEATEFYQIALTRGGALPQPTEAELCERLANEYYLTDRLDSAIAARRRALRLREQLREPVAIAENHHALALYESYNADLPAAEHHAAQAVSALDGQVDQRDRQQLVTLGNALATQAYFALSAADLARAETLLTKARRCDGGDPVLDVRLRIIEGYRGGLAGEDGAHDGILSSIGSASDLHADDLYAYGCSILAFIDIEQRRHANTAELLDISVPVSVERDVPFTRSWLLAMRARLALLVGDWDDAATDAGTVLASPGGRLVSTWPLVVRTLISLRREGTAEDGIDEAWDVFRRFGEHYLLFPAAAIAERVWLTGRHDDRLDECRALIDSCPVGGIDMAIGDLAVWLHRLDGSVGTDRAVGPHRLLLDGDYAAAAEEFHRLSMPYEAALAFVDSGDPVLIRRGLDGLDNLGAAAVAAKVRRALRSGGATAVPARRRASTLANPAGLTARQIEVLQLIGDGMTNAELAGHLYLSVRTVDHHVAAILGKLVATGRRDAVRKGRELGLLP